MRTIVLPVLSFLSTAVFPQYGTVDPKTVAFAKTLTTLVVLDDGDSPYNRAITDAVKAHWTFTGGFDFIHVHDLAVAPVAADRIYLMKTIMNDPERHTMTFLALVQGWKQKKGETLEMSGAAFSNVNGDQVLASIQCDPAWLADHQATAMYGIYVKHIQDYLTLVEAGTIMDKATADRTYASRNRMIKDRLQFSVAKEHLDKSLPDAAAVKTHYTHPVEVAGLEEVLGSVDQQDASVCVTDVILTGTNEKKHCFKRVFNCRSGELMYLRDDAALFGKKEGFLDEDFKQLERAR